MPVPRAVGNAFLCRSKGATLVGVELIAKVLVLVMCSSSLLVVVMVETVRVLKLMQYKLNAEMEYVYKAGMVAIARHSPNPSVLQDGWMCVSLVNNPLYIW